MTPTRQETRQDAAPGLLPARAVCEGGGLHTTVPLLQRRCHVAGPRLSALLRRPSPAGVCLSRPWPRPADAQEEHGAQRGGAPEAQTQRAAPAAAAGV
jgi:hypothetical protein